MFLHGDSLVVVAVGVTKAVVAFGYSVDFVKMRVGDIQCGIWEQSLWNRCRFQGVRLPRGERRIGEHGLAVGGLVIIYQ